MNNIDRMKELIKKLNTWSYEYYTLGTPSVSDETYDKYYDELIALEKECGIVYANSPTQKVGYEVLDKLPKVKHDSPMLSLAKVKYKDIEKELIPWIGEQEVIGMFKADGLTIKLTYNNGSLIQAETRGNGEVGTLITELVKYFANVPLTIPYKDKVSITGEGVILYEDFERVNKELVANGEEPKANPRNLVCGTLNNFDTRIVKNRNIRFYGYIIEGVELNTKWEQLAFIESLGIEVIPYYHAIVTKDNVILVCDELKTGAESMGFPIDGVVFMYNSIAYGENLGRTAKFPKHSIAMKYTEDIEETVIKDIVYQVGRTGKVTPVALFDPVELAGTVVKRATLNNLKYVNDLEIGIGDIITVFKANEIIPTVKDNITRSGTHVPPTTCPECGSVLEVVNDIQYCQNDKCPSRLNKRLEHFCSKGGMNIEGLSSKTIIQLIEALDMKSITDIYKYSDIKYKPYFLRVDKFGEKKYDNLINAIEKSKKVKLENFIYALGIPNVGLETAKDICKAIGYDLQTLYSYELEDFKKIEGIGDKVAAGIMAWLQDERNLEDITVLKEYGITFIKEEEITIVESDNPFSGKEIYFTGSFELLGKKEQIKALCKEYNITFASGFKKSNDYLVVGNKKGSSKSEKAKSMCIEVLSETEFIKELKGEC